MTTTERKVNFGESVKQIALDYIYNAELSDEENEQFAKKVLTEIDTLMKDAGYWYYDDQTGTAVYEIGTEPKTVNFDAVINCAIEIADDDPYGTAAEYKDQIYED